MIARDRAEHAAKYGAHLVVDATELLALLDERDTAETARDDARSDVRELREELDRAHLSASLHLEALATLDAVRQLLTDADRHQNAFIQTGHLRDALAEGGDDR